MMPTSSALSKFFALGFEVDNDVRDRNGEPLLGPADDAALQPVGAAFGMRGDDHLVGAERPQSVFDRLERIGVADLASGGDSDLLEPREALLEPLPRLASSLVLVRDPVLERCVEGGRDDEHLRPRSLRALSDHLPKRPSPDRLVCDHEDPLLIDAPLMAGRGHDRLQLLTPEEPEDNRNGQDCENTHAPPAAADETREHDRGEVDDRPEQESIRLRFAAEWVPHG